MTDDVQWPRASEGGEVSGKADVRAYWLRQWAEFNPHMKPIGITGDGRIFDVTVHQVVKSLGGEVLWDGTVHRRFTL